MASKTGLLLEWAQRHTAGFPGVAVRDFTRSWRSGLAWGALIAHFAPAALDFSTLDQRAATENDADACRANLTKVFAVAKTLGIPPLLDVDDMVDLPVPEKLSVTTYTICFYNRFGEDGQPRHEAGIRASAPSKLAGPAEAPELGAARRPPERRRLLRTTTTGFLANFGSDNRSPSTSPVVPQRTVVTRLGASASSSSSSTSGTATGEAPRPHGGLLVRSATGTSAAHAEGSASASSSSSGSGAGGAGTAGGECPRCGKPFGTDELAPVNVAGQQYHLGCFICNTCKKHIDPNSEWKRRGGVFVCERHALRTHTMSSFSLQMPSLPSANASPETPLWKKKLLEERKRKLAESADKDARRPLAASVPATASTGGSEDSTEASSVLRRSEGSSSSSSSSSTPAPAEDKNENEKKEKKDKKKDKEKKDKEKKEKKDKDKDKDKDKEKKEKKEKKEHKHKHHKKDGDSASKDDKDADEGTAAEVPSTEAPSTEPKPAAEVPAEKPAAEPLAKETPAPAPAPVVEKPAPAPVAEKPAPVAEKPAPAPAAAAPEPAAAPAPAAPAAVVPAKSEESTTTKVDPYKQGFKTGMGIGAVLGSVLTAMVFFVLLKLQGKL